MREVQAHYDAHLAPVYAWSAGGAEAAIAEGARWLATLPLPAPPARVLDLGAGFGATAIPLARAGHHVLAVDSSAALLGELTAAGAPMEAERADLLAFLRAEERAWDVVLCVGDTLPHLGSHEDVDALLGEIARVLAPGGLAVLSYRPRRELAPAERFVLVRADERRTLTAFLEPIDDAHQMVWDVIHERIGAETTMRVSGYRKLRIDPSWIAARASGRGLVVEERPPHRGMVVALLRARTARRA
jgi:2-polyprenyl-3-methyl-5-hydroxy-6-metoxy-1,4-benzoquinol methylase